MSATVIPVDFRRRVRICAACGAAFNRGADGAGYKLCSAACRAASHRAASSRSYANARAAAA